VNLALVREGLDRPEGPIAMADGSVIVCEVRGQRLTRVWPDGRKDLVVQTGGGPNGAAIGSDDAISTSSSPAGSRSRSSWPRGGWCSMARPRR